jgi:RND family efflux transporter MFP subunit
MIKIKLSLVFISVGAVFFLTTGCGGKAENSVAKLRYVKVVQPENGVAGATTEFNGVVQEGQIAAVAFRVGGPVTAILAEEGDYVQKGDLLAAIDPRDYQVHVSVAQAQYQQAKGEYERFSQLYNDDKLPANTYEKLKLAYKAAESNYENAKNALSDTKLTAPMSGYVFKRFINKHETIGPGMPAFTVLNMNDLEVVFGVPESMVAKLSSSVTAKVFVLEHNIDAIVKSVAGKSGDNNLYEVRLGIKNPDAKSIRPGMSARIVVNGENVGNTALVIPVESLFYKQGAAYVWVFNELQGVVQMRGVTIGQLTTTGQVQIVEGLKGSDKVVCAGTHSLHDNQPVRIMPLKM